MPKKPPVPMGPRPQRPSPEELAQRSVARLEAASGDPGRVLLRATTVQRWRPSRPRSPASLARSYTTKALAHRDTGDPEALELMYTDKLESFLDQVEEATPQGSTNSSTLSCVLATAADPGRAGTGVQVSTTGPWPESATYRPPSFSSPRQGLRLADDPP